VTVTTRLYCGGRLEEVDFDPDRIDRELEQPDALVWLDLDEPTPDKIAMLGREFGFHPLALEDCLHEHQRPKIEQYEGYYFLVAYGIDVAGTELAPHEMAVFVGHRFLVTVRKPPAFDLAEVLKRWDAHAEQVGEGGGYLLYILLDEIVDGYFDALDVLEDRTEEVEDVVLAGEATPRSQSDIFQLRKQLIQFRRGMAPLREVLDVLQRRTADVVTPGLEPYYRDVYDHVLRATDFLDSLRDILSSALEANLSIISNRLNEVMKKLTAWAAIILVPALIAGIYGMNFRHMPELRWRWGYPYALGLMAAICAGLWWMFKRRDWL
jgi:magnesium transporter